MTAEEAFVTYCSHQGAVALQQEEKMVCIEGLERLKFLNVIEDKILVLLYSTILA